MTYPAPVGGGMSPKEWRETDIEHLYELDDRWQSLREQHVELLYDLAAKSASRIVLRS